MITLLNEALKNLSNIHAKFPKVETITNDYENDTKELIDVYQLDEKSFLLITTYVDSYGRETITSIQICERTVPKSYNYKPI